MNTRLTIRLQNASARNIDDGCEIALNDVVMDHETMATIHKLLLERDVPNYIATATTDNLTRMMIADTLARRMLP